MKISFVMTQQTVEPLGIMYLISQLQRQNHLVIVFKATTNESLVKHILEYKPDIACFSMTTGQHVRMLELVKVASTLSVVTIIGGPHPTYFPEVGELDYVDYFIRGEADYTLPTLIKLIHQNNAPKNGEFGNMILPIHLDFLPFPNRKYVYEYKEFGNNKTRNILTARGCPYSCTYCYNSATKEMYKGQKIVRFRSPQNIIDECKDVMTKYPTNMFFFADDEFSMDFGRLCEIKDRYISMVKLPFHCQLRIDILDEKRIKVLQEMGCYSLTFAIESGDEEIRRSVLGRNISNKQIIEGAKMLKSAGIKFRAENMCGLPNETWEQTLKTLKLNSDVHPDYAWISLYQPYPGTKLGNYCKENGLCETGVDGIKEKFTEDTVLKMSLKDKKQLINFQRLFGLLVEFKTIRMLLPVLTRLPLTGVYTKLRNFWKQYCYSKRLFKLS